ncbi:hypothetical protein T265_07368 [Opisthorchis viverrini]|uniref:Uncharacterized protein n=1 Tax=Opisthorchis viverrini TaxID=6198 RepID=A0A074ZHG1_OPIVI|nr:hypothetical protein T265_07368 [Opisthorchis viverrini]KER25147.1 hypothetical protein T265_07368 [Opisthorchis viverrini]
MNKFRSVLTLCMVILVAVFAQEEEGTAEASEAPAESQAHPEPSKKPSKACIPKDGKCSGTLIKACCGSLRLSSGRMDKDSNSGRLIFETTSPRWSGGLRRPQDRRHSVYTATLPRELLTNKYLMCHETEKMLLNTTTNNSIPSQRDLVTSHAQSPMKTFLEGSDAADHSYFPDIQPTYLSGARVLHRFADVKGDLTREDACQNLLLMAPRFWQNGLLLECELKNFINGIGDFVVYVNVKKLMARYRDINAHGLSWLTTRRLNNDSGSCMTATGIINNIAIFRVTDFSSRDYSSNSRGEPDLNVALFSWVLEWNTQPRSLMDDLGFFRIMDYWSTYTNILLRRGTVPPKRICSLVEFLRVAKPRWTYFVQIFLPLLYRRGFCIDGKITYMLQQVVYTKHSLEQISGRGFAYFTVVNCKLYFKHPAVLNKQLIATYELTLDKTADRFKVHHLLEQLNEGRSRCRYNGFSLAYFH